MKESIQVDNLVSQTIKSDAPPPPPKVVKDMPSSYQLTAPLSEGELTSMLMSSPLYQKLESIKSLLKSGAGKGGGGPASTPGKYCMEIMGGNLFINQWRRLNNIHLFQ